MHDDRRTLFPDHAAMVDALVAAGEPLDNEALRATLAWSQTERFTRVRDSLVALGVIRRLPSGRGGRLRLVTTDLAPLYDALLEPAPGRERALYGALIGPIYGLVEGTYGTELAPDEDRVAVYRTAEHGARTSTGRSVHADLTILVDLVFPNVGPWRDVHAVHVAPYWTVSRQGLYDAATQAAMQRCTHSWLVLYLPDRSAVSGADAQAQVDLVRELLPDLTVEAQQLGLGLAYARTTRDSEVLDVLAVPRRQVLNPIELDRFLVSLGNGA